MVAACVRNVKFMSAAVSCESCRAASADDCRTLTLKISLSLHNFSPVMMMTVVKMRIADLLISSHRLQC